MFLPCMYVCLFYVIFLCVWSRIRWRRRDLTSRRRDRHARRITRPDPLAGIYILHLYIYIYIYTFFIYIYIYNPSPLSSAYTYPLSRARTLSPASWYLLSRRAPLSLSTPASPWVLTILTSFRFQPPTKRLLRGVQHVHRTRHNTHENNYRPKSKFF